MTEKIRHVRVLDKNMNMQSILSNDNPEACPFFDDLHVESLDGRATYEFSVPADHWVAEHVKEENYVLLPDLDNRLVLFQIKRAVEKLDTDGKLVKEAYAENAALELLGHPVRPITMTDVTAKEALTTILAGSRWTPGQVDYAGLETVEIEDYMTAIEAVHKIREIFGLELRYSVTLKSGRIIDRLINLVTRRGQDRGKRFEYGKDIVGMEATYDSTMLATALIGLGKSDENGERLTFKDVEWTVAGGDPVDKPPGQDWVGDPEAVQRWGIEGKHVTGFFDDPDETEPLRLLRRTWDELQRRKEPAATFETSVALLARLLGLQHEEVRLGDGCLVRNMEFSPPVLHDARVVELRISYSDRTRDSAVLGEYKPAVSKSIAAFRALEKRVYAGEGFWESGEYIAKALTPPEDPPDGRLWIDTSESPAVWKRWDGTEWENITRTAFEQLEGTVEELQIADRAVTETKIALGAVTKDILAASAVTETKISDDAISTPKIQAGAIVSGKIAAGEVLAENIGAGAVTTEKIYAGAVTAEKINVAELSAISANIGFVTAGEIGADVIFAGELVAATGTFESLMAGTAGGARLETGESAGEPYLRTYDASNYLRIDLLKDRLDFYREGSRVGGIRAEYINEYYRGAILGDVIYLEAGGNVIALNASVSTSGAALVVYPTWTWVKELEVGGHIVPEQGQDNVYDIGNPLDRWRDLYLGGQAYIDGIAWLGNLLVFGDDQNKTSIDPSGGVFRLRADASNYLYMGIEELRYYGGGSVVLRLWPRVDGDDTHWALRIGGATTGSAWKSLGGTERALQARRGDDGAYIKVQASDFEKVSKKEFKKSIAPLDSALGQILNTPVYTYKVEGDPKTQAGIMFEEAPEILRSGECVSLGSSVGLLWRAVQELNEKIEGGETRVQDNLV